VLIRFPELKEKLFEILLLRGFQPEDAQILADIFSETTLDGVFSHGVNRFPLFIDLVEKGVIMQDAKPKLISMFGTTEQWDGCRGPGILNARFCMNKAIQLAKEHGSGFVTLRNTNHWMRGGTYGWQAAMPE
jgi:3-dehydro-L-gulonate 2-dehydrogenase